MSKLFGTLNPQSWMAHVSRSVCDCLLMHRQAYRILLSTFSTVVWCKELLWDLCCLRDKLLQVLLLYTCDKGELFLFYCSYTATFVVL